MAIAGWRCEAITICSCIGFHALRLILRDAFFRSASSANALLKRKVAETWQLKRPIWGSSHSDWSSLILTEEHYLLSAACRQTEICLWLTRIHLKSLKKTPTFSQRPSICRKKWSQGSKSNRVQRFTLSRSPALPMICEAIHAFGCSYFSSLDLADLASRIPSTYKEKWGESGELMFFWFFLRQLIFQFTYSTLPSDSAFMRFAKGAFPSLE